MPVAATELVRLAVAHFGSQKELAIAMGLGPSGSSTVSRWANGVHALDYEHTMDLLDACGWLKLDGRRRKQGDQASSQDPLESVAAGVEEAVKNSTEILRLLQAGQAAPARKPQQATPKSRKAARG